MEQAIKLTYKFDENKINEEVNRRYKLWKKEGIIFPKEVIKNALLVQLRNSVISQEIKMTVK